MKIYRSKVWNSLILPFGASLLSILYTIFWRFVTPLNARATAKQRVLFVAHNQMMARYLSQVADLLKNDKRIELYVTSPIGGRKVTAPFFDPTRTSYVGYRWSRFMWWDMLVFAEHASVQKFHPEIPRVYTSHGIPSGARSANNDEYGYGRYAFNPDGSPCYSLMFEQSEATLQRVLKRHPNLVDRVALVGDLRIEAMLQLNASRNDIRKRLGFEPDDVVCLFMSSWQEHSLLPTVGKRLIEQAEQVMDVGKVPVHNLLTPKSFGVYTIAHRSRGMNIFWRYASAVFLSLNQRKNGSSIWLHRI